MDFNLWVESITNPIQTFKKEKKKADLVQGMIHIALAGLVTGVIKGLYDFMIGSVIGGVLGPMFGQFPIGGFMGAVGAISLVLSIIFTPIFSVIIWLIVSGILYIFAMLFGGKGDYKTQSYLYAIYSAPLSIIITVISIIPIIGILAIIPWLYGLYLLTMALKEAHGYTMGKAVLTWLIPVLILVVIIGIIGIAIAALLFGSIASSMPLIPGRI